MKKIILAILLSAIMLLCGCGMTVSTTPSGSASTERETAAAEMSAPVSDALPSASVGLVIPRETKVYAAEGELAGVKPLFESYLSGKDLLAFAVSAVFKGDVYLMGFVYKNDEWKLPFNRVIGLKQNGTVIEEAFISDNYDNPEGWIPDNFTFLEWDETFYDTQAFEYNGMLVVLTKEALNEDEAMNNIFVIDEEGMLCNYVCGWPYRPYLREGNLLFYEYEDYTWSEFSVQNNEVVLKEITYYTPYRPEIKEEDIVIDLKSCTPGAYDEDTETFSNDNNIELYINDEKLDLENFGLDGTIDDEYGQLYKDYYSKKEFKIDIGSNIIIIYPPGTKADCYIYGYGGEDYSLPGVSVFKATETGEYTAVVSTDHECYNIRIAAE